MIQFNIIFDCNVFVFMMVVGFSVYKVWESCGCATSKHEVFVFICFVFLWANTQNVLGVVRNVRYLFLFVFICFYVIL